MDKNLLLIHLESLNSINFRNNSYLYPFLSDMYKKCTAYNNYFSTATSTYMVLSDILYGGMEQFEQCNSLNTIPQEYYYSSSLMDELKYEGYNSAILAYPKCDDTKEMNSRNLVGFDNRIVETNNYQEHINNIETIFMSDKPFALLLCNYISNVSMNSLMDIADYPYKMSQWEAAYRAMDKYCQSIIELLEKAKKLNDTIIVFYGDHGDDFYGHGIHKGLTHAIEPYNFLINVPLFIWNPYYEKNVYEDTGIIQSTDMKELIISIMSQEVFEVKRKYAFSRNEYAAQPLRTESFNKSYSVTDGHYLLIASNKGIEMYDIVRDCACQDNMLSHFCVSDGFLRFDCSQVEVMNIHFPILYSAREQRIIRNKFYELNEVLISEVQTIYKMAGLSIEQMYDEIKFNIIRDDYE